MKRKSTMVELVDELKNLPQSPELDFIIQEALAGEYHDYKNKKYTCGKVESHNKLKKLGHDDLANRIANGEFDEEADEQDKAELKKSALEGGFNEAQCEKLFGL